MEKQAQLPKENIYGHTKKLRFLIEQIERSLDESDGPITLLDFGCGNGRAVSQFLMHPRVSYYGIDFHEPSLTFARRHYGSERARFLDAIPQNVEFDLIVYADILEHLDDPVGLLKQHITLLKDGGMIAGSVPNGYGPFENEKRVDHLLHLSDTFAAIVSLKRKLFGRRSPLASEVPYNSESGHLQFFTQRTLVQTLSKAGFGAIEFQKGTFLGAPISAQLLLRGEGIARLNARMADFLPYWSLSTWYFSAKKVLQNQTGVASVLRRAS